MRQRWDTQNTSQRWITTLHQQQQVATCTDTKDFVLSPSATCPAAAVSLDG
jgi:hypothetical protein